MKTQQYKFKSIGDLNIKDRKKLQSNSSTLTKMMILLMKKQEENIL